MYSTIHEAAEAIRAGKTTPVELLDQCLARIDKYEEKVRAWVFVDRESARAQAEALTRELQQGSRRGPLHGIPIAVKDIFDVFDWPTAAGSKLWAQSIARADASVVRSLRHAGAVFIGKTVTTQYASFDPPPTRNPWNHAHTPGGSSSGSAAALACGMCLGALGSQTGGSITRPASYCGVAGLKPTFECLPVDGVVPLAPSMDHPGPMATCVRDLAILFEGMSPPYVVAARGPSTPPRLGRLYGIFHDYAPDSIRSFMDDVCVRLFREKIWIDIVTAPASMSEVIYRHRMVMAVEAAKFHEPRLRRHPQDYGPEIRKLLEEGIACPAPEYARCKEHQRRLREEMLACFEGVDALLTPATTSPAPPAQTTGDPAFNSPWSYTGLPTVSLPAGWSPEGLPLAIQLVGRPGSEAALLAIGEWCEKAVALERREPPV
jgi:Asp-tRNA(Asn)/Glu-tRNA(Gln) amidotransferase A subunit family amidase